MVTYLLAGIRIDSFDLAGEAARTMRLTPPLCETPQASYSWINTLFIKIPFDRNESLLSTHLMDAASTKIPKTVEKLRRNCNCMFTGPTIR
jgi:hypothetical protein